MKFLFSTAVLALLLSTSALKAGEVVGFYSQGELWDADSVLNHTPRFTKLFLNREKHYTSVEMRDVLQELADYTATQFQDSEVLQVGDLSQQGGGPIPRHVSHQNGIDADLVYLRVNRETQSPDEAEWAESFVEGSRVTDNFDLERNWKLLKHTVESYDVGRIFVDSAIKRKFCEYARHKNIMNDEDVVAFLRRLRPARYHDTHFHVRLKCPQGHPRCEEQHAPPQGHGCSESDLLSLSTSC